VKKFELKLIVENVPVLILRQVDYNNVELKIIALLISDF